MPPYYRVRQMFDDGSNTLIEGLTLEDLLALIETLDNLPSMMVTAIFPDYIGVSND